MIDRDHCSNTPAEILAAIRAIEAQRDAYIRSLSNGDRADAGVIARFQKDIEALKQLAGIAEAERANREWLARDQPASG
jgi:hypothetical protein